MFKPSFQGKVEFWAATTIFAFSVFFLLSGIVNAHEGLFFDPHIPFNYYGDFIFPSLIRYTFLYGAFLLLNFKVLPKLVAKERVALNCFYLILIFLATGTLFGITDTYLKKYLFDHYVEEDAAYAAFFQGSFSYAFRLLMILGFYTVLKYISVYLLSHSETIQAKYQILTRDVLAAFVLWLVSLFLLMIIDAEGEFLLSWGIIAPTGILLYGVSFYYFIPKALPSKKPFLAYLWRAVLLLAVSFLPLAILLMTLTNEKDFALGLPLFNVFFHLFLTTPVCWVLFKRQMQGKEEVYVLQKELGRSNANFDFLRSQINPHFLFNTLNTLYGTALQENSERTAQGIQMLGDMMRFMLHENNQQKILLSREIDYMRNYIELQSLRTSTSPDITIQTQIEEVYTEKFIAPMLLIPFVENAFKHGISLKEKSWIRVTLHLEQNKLYFDVYNSTHVKPEQDPEKDKSGVGLENVRQRLALLYPQKHELVIRETLGEFFVHLTVEL